MITYTKTAWGLHLLYRLYGSAVLRCAPFAALSGAQTALLWVYWGGQGLDKSEAYYSWRHPYPYALSAFIVGFVVVFRSNFGYARYWEGRTTLQEMTGRWADACTQANIFFTGPSCNPERSLEFRETLVHLMSLMHALALQHVRGDWDLHNLQAAHPTDPPPPVDAAALQYLIGPATRGDGTWRLPFGDLFLLRGTEDKRNRYNRRVTRCSKAMPLGVIGGVSSEEEQLLGSGMMPHSAITVDSSIYGEDLGGQSCMTAFFGLSTGRYVPGAAERVNILHSWVLQLLKQRFLEGDLMVPAPIAANLYRMLSDGLLGFENARKLSDTPFPFPWAQAVLLLLLVFAFTLPFLIVGYVRRLWLAVLLDVITVQSYFALNEVARDLEDPFVFEPNDLPLARIQYQFNERIKAATSKTRPPYFSKGRECMRSQIPEAEREKSGEEAPNIPNIRSWVSEDEADDACLPAIRTQRTFGLRGNGSVRREEERLDPRILDAHPSANLSPMKFRGLAHPLGSTRMSRR